MLIETLVFIGAVVVFVNSALILMLVLAVGKLIRDFDDMKKHGTCREMRNMIKVYEKINNLSRELHQEVEDNKDSIAKFISNLFTVDYYGYENLECSRVPKSEAIEFKRVQDAGDEKNKKLIVMKYYTSKKNADKHKDEIKAFRAEVEKLEKINTCAFPCKDKK